MLTKGTDSLRTENHESAHEATQELRVYQDTTSDVTPRRCSECDQELTSKRRKTCSDACRKKASRRNPAHSLRREQDKQRKRDRRSAHTKLHNKKVAFETERKFISRLGYSGTTRSSASPYWVPSLGEMPLAPMPPRVCGVCSSVLTNKNRTCDDCKAKAKLSEKCTQWTAYINKQNLMTATMKDKILTILKEK